MIQNYLLPYILPLIYILVISLINIALLRRSFGQVFPLVFLESGIILFPFGFFNLSIGIYIIATVSILALIYLVLFAPNRNANWKIWIKQVIDDDFLWVFLIVYTFVFAINLGKDFSHWDEYSHWGIMAKDLFYNNRFYFYEGSRLTVHNEYPPFATLIEYLWCKLSLSYNEKYLYSGNILFALSLLFPLINNSDQTKRTIANRIPNILLYSIIIILLPVTVTIGEATFYRTIYVEGLLSSLIVFCIYMCFVEDNSTFRLLCQTTGLIALVLTKQIAIYFVVTLLAYQLLIAVLKYIQKTNKKILCINSTVPYLISIITWKIWGILSARYTSDGQFDSSKFSISNIINLISGNGEEYQYITLRRYISSLFTDRLNANWLGLPYYAYIFIAIITVIAISRLRKSNGTAINYAKWIYIILSAIGYSFVMLISYLFGFSEGESVNLACFDRYMGIVIFVILITAFLDIYHAYSNKGKHILILIVCTVILVFVTIPSHVITEQLLPGFTYDKYCGIFDGDSRIINEHTDSNSSIYLICQGDNGSARNVIAYNCYPHTFNTGGYSIIGMDDKTDGYSMPMNEDVLIDRLNNYDYLYIAHMDDQLISIMNKIIASDLDYKDQMLFKIVKNSSTMQLVQLEI